MKKSLLLWSAFFTFVLILTACGGGGGGGDSSPSPVTPVATTSSVTYDGNGNTGGGVPTDTTNYAQDQVVTVLGNPGSLVKTHFTFGGWNTAADGGGTNYAQGQTFKMGSTNVKLYAKWTANPTYTVTYNGNGADPGGSVPTDTTNYETGNTVTVLGNTGNLVKAGSTFIGWNTASNASGTVYTQGSTFTMGSADITLYAVWTTNPTYTVTYNGNGADSGTAPVDTTNYEQGFFVTVLGNPGNLAKTGSTFSGWNTAADGSGTTYTQGQTFTIGSANVILHAKWTVTNPTYTMTYNGNGNTGGSVPIDSTNYETGNMVTVLGNTGTLVKNGSAFSGWNTQADGNGITYTQGQTFTMGAANVILYAKWTTATYTVTYDGNGMTGGSVPTDTTSYNTGNTVTVLGNTGNLVRTGYTFTGWNTASNGSGTTYRPGNTFAMGSANVILYARWTTGSTYTVTYNGNGQTSGTVPADPNNYEPGDTITVLGNTGGLVKTGSTFAGWNTASNGSGNTYTEGNTFAMGSANVTLYAIWAAPINTATFTADGVIFNMVQVPGKTFPTGTGDGGTETVAGAYWIGETEVTYELWNTVHTWAIANGYNFQNAGYIGSSNSGSIQQPVTMINWRDAMVWANAATEWYNAKNGTTYTPVYTSGGLTIKDSRDSNAAACDAVVAGAGNGFRLLTSNEWELAARYKVDANSDGYITNPGEYYPGNYASGATAPTTDAAATGLVAWYFGNTEPTTHDVKTKAANALGLYDMSGNVWEWCFDLSGTNRVYRGGSWISEGTWVQVGYVEQLAPNLGENKTGFRIGRTQ